MSLLHYWDTQRSAKRRKTSGTESGRESIGSGKTSPTPSTPGAVDTPPLIEELETQLFSSQTDLETSLPPIQTDEQAIEEYEASGSQSHDTGEPGLHVRLRDGVWQRGKSSIYVDAFNLTLETVLNEESHLFDERELQVFSEWKDLSYEAQYLYVSFLSPGQ